MKKTPILVTGATGYVGGRLIPRLLSTGYRVRAMARSIDKLKSRSWTNHPRLETVQADLFDAGSLAPAFKGCRAAYYLVHSMNPEQRDFARADRLAATNFIRAAAEASLERIVYLGGLGDETEELSLHLKSRAEVGRILHSGPVPATILRSAVILGSGSASFEILRHLAERLPLMLVPRQVADTRIQPICIRNVLNFLVECLDKDETTGRIFDIGGPDVLTYRQLFNIYSEEAGLNKPLFVTPDLRPTMLGHRLGISMAKLALPMPPSITDPLLEGLVHNVVVEDDSITKIIPQDLMTCREAIRRAIQKESLQIVETRWTDAGSLKPPEWVYHGDAPYSGGTLLQGGFRAVLAASPEDIWPLISRIGGRNGWYHGDYLWRIRGWMDSMVGGVGLRRGRRHQEQLQVGDALDFWRVLDVDPPRRLILVAEMKLPGEAILDIELKTSGESNTELRFNTRFKPKGLYGLGYWYSLLPLHDHLFGGLLKEVARRAGKPILRGPQKYKPEPISQRNR